MDWTKQFFDKTWLEFGFDLVSEKQTLNEVALIERALKLQKGETVLDLCCGIGRHSIELAQRGYNVTGIDSSHDCIMKAKSSSMKMRTRPVFATGDIRKIPYINKFDAAFCVWLGFGFYDEETDLKILKGIARALRQRGRILLDVPSRDYILRHFQQRDWNKAGRGYVMEKRLYHPESSRLSTTWIFADISQLTRKKSDIRLYGMSELEALLKKAGFRILNRYGDMQKASPSLETPRLIYAATLKR